MRKDVRILMRLQNLHAPLGRATPLAASALFAVAGLSTSILLRVVAYGLASLLAIVIAIDIGVHLLEYYDNDSMQKRIAVTPFQFVLAAIQAFIYTILIFGGLGPATPFIFLVPVFAFSSIASWHNVRVWYRQGVDYETRLYDLQAEEAVRRHRSELSAYREATSGHRHMHTN